MTKPREFWIEGTVLKSIGGINCHEVTKIPQDYGYIHVREVLPIDWGNFWIEFHKVSHFSMIQSRRELIQQLVEKQLRGDNDF